MPLSSLRITPGEIDMGLLNPGQAKRKSPSLGETFVSLMRSESLASGVYGLATNMESTHEERVRSLNTGFSAEAATDAALENDPFWAGDDDAEFELRTATSREEFAFKKARMDTLYQDRDTIDRSGTPTVLLQSLGMGLVDPFSLGFGIATGGGVPIARAVAYSGAKYLRDSFNITSSALKRVKAVKAAAEARHTSDMAVQIKALRVKKNRVTKASSKQKYQDQIDVLEASSASTPIQDSVISTLTARLGVQANVAMKGEMHSPVFAASIGALTEATFTEILLQQQQIGRTAQETMYNVLGAVAVSGLLNATGGLYRVYMPRVTDPFIKKYEMERGITSAKILEPATGDDSLRLDSRDAELATTGNSPNPTWDSMNENLLSSVRDRELADQYRDDPVGYRQAKTAEAKKYTGVAKAGFMKLIRILHPSARLATSELVAPRLLGEALAQNDYMYNNMYNSGKVRQVAVETYVQHDIREGSILTTDILDVGYLAVNKKMETLGNSGLKKALWGTNERYARFKEEVWNDLIDKGYMRDVSGELRYRDQDNPFAGLEKEIRAASDELLNKVLKPWEKRLIDAGLLKSEKIPIGHRAYLHRVWDRDAVRRDPGDLERVLRNHFTMDWERKVIEESKSDDESLMYARDEILGLVREGGIDEPRFKKLTQMHENLEKDVREFIDSVTGDQLGIADMERLTPSKTMPSSLRNRAPVPTAALRKYMVKDVGAIVQTWLRDVAPDFRLYEKFGDGYSDKINAAIQTEARTRIDDLNTLKAGSTDKTKIKAYDKEIERIVKDREEAVRSVTNIIDVLRNRYGIPDDPESILNSTGKIVRSLNFATKLGGMTLSALTDLAYVVAKVGLRHALPGIMRGMAGFGTLHKQYKSMGTKAFREYRKDAHFLATVSEMQLHNRMEAVTMMEDIRGTGNKVDRGIHALNTNFARLSFMNTWNDWLKSITHMAYTNKIRDAIDEGRWNELADLGITPEAGGKIKAAWAKHGKDEGGLFVPNAREWHTSGRDGIEAADALKYALIRVVDSTVVTPGAGDIPFILRTPMGKIMGQFQTFPIAVMNRVVAPAIQRTSMKDPTPLIGMGLAIAVGGMVYQLKEMAAGREPTEDMDIWLYEAIQRSGMFGIYANALTLTDNVTGGVLGRGLFGEDFEAPHRSRDPFIDVLGPTVRTGQDIFKAATGLATMISSGDDMSWGQGSAIRRLIPGNNLFYLRLLGMGSGPTDVQQSFMNQKAPQ